MVENGYLVIADISGYSKFLHESELDHARDSLSDLLDILVEHTRSPLRIVELEGDAVFSHAPASEVRTAETLTAMVENAYVAFRRALNLMVINTTCTCKACRLLPTLDLKFFIHYGRYARQDVREHKKLVGNDVNLIHHLLKNAISEVTGLEAYAAYTESAVEKLELDREGEGFVSHTEPYPDMEEVQLCVADMHDVWERARNKNRVRVDEQDALETLEADFSPTSEEMWHYITDPVTRNLLTHSNWQRLETRPDRGRGPGATYVCAHGDSEVLHTIVDWEPPETYTVRIGLPFPNTTALSTYQLVPLDQGTRLRLLVDRTRGPWLFRLLGNLQLPRVVRDHWKKGIHLLRQRIEIDRGGAAASTSNEPPIRGSFDN